MPAAALAQLEEFAFRFGTTYDSYLVTEGAREYFFSAGRKGVVAFQRWGRNMQVVGGLLAAPEDQEQLLDELTEFARRKGWRLMIFGLNRNDFKLYRDSGFQVSKFGEEPIIVLDETQWTGQAYEWIRRQEKACQKSGVAFREIHPNDVLTEYTDKIAPELEAISREHLAETLHRREMTFFVGQFDPHALGRRRLFVAETAGRIECFLVLNPCLAGAMWAVEVFRKRRDAVRGVIPFAILQVMRQLQREKVRYASLSLVPWLRSDVVFQGASYTMRWASFAMNRYGNALYDVRGMYHFKSRFRPHWRELYVASAPALGWSSIVAIGMSWGLFRVNPFRLLAHWWRDLRDPSRKSLAAPGSRPERTLRSVRIDPQHDDLLADGMAAEGANTVAPDGAER